MPSQILTSQTIADTLGISVQRVRQLAKELNIEPQTIGKALIFTPADLKKMQGRSKKVGRPKLPQSKNKSA
jgi:hypothetical protein